MMTTSRSIVERLIRGPLPKCARELNRDAAPVHLPLCGPVACASNVPGRARDGHSDDSGKAAAVARRPVEYLVRILRNPDRLRASEREHEPHLPVAWIERRQFAGAVGGGA